MMFMIIMRMMSLKQKATPLSKLEIKPSFYKYKKLLHCELDIKTLTNDGGMSSELLFCWVPVTFVLLQC